jgi:hypothetical protein
MKINIILFVLLIPMTARTQPRVYLSGVAGTYLMSDMKAFQKQLHESADFLPLKIVSSFPASFQGEAGLVYGLDEGKKTIGGYVNYAYTRGRMHYADYSGSATYDLDLMRIGFGVRGTQRIIKHLSAYAKLGLCVTLLDINSEIVVGDNPADEDNESFHALGVAVEPGLQWEYPYKRFSFYVNGGFEINLNGKTMYDGDSHLIDSDNNPVKIDWTGVRLGVGVMFRLMKNG